MDEYGLIHSKGTRSEKAPTSIKLKFLETLGENGGGKSTEVKQKDNNFK